MAKNAFYGEKSALLSPFTSWGKESMKGIQGTVSSCSYEKRFFLDMFFYFLIFPFFQFLITFLFMINNKIKINCLFPPG